MELRNIAASLRHLRPRRAAVAVGNVAACAGLLGFIACADGAPTEPRTSSATAASPAFAAAPMPPVTAATTTWSGDTTVYTFTYAPATGSTVNLAGGAQIVLPAGSVCDPATSGYGASLWNATCQAATQTIPFTARARTTSTGDVQVVVSPDVRFVPGAGSKLTLPAPYGSATNVPVIQWCTSGFLQCVDEGATDPALATAFDAKRRLASRRIKHFSGYNINYSKGSSAPAPTLAK